MKNLRCYHTLEVTLLCQYLFELFGDNGKIEDIIQILGKISKSCYSGRISVKDFESLLNLERRVMNASGKNKQCIETKVLEIISNVSFEDERKNYDTFISRIYFLKTVSKQQRQLVAKKLKDFAIQIFSIKRNRDAYSNKRKSFALALLGNVAVSYDCPEALEKCLFALRSGKKSLILAATEFLEEHYIRQGTRLPADIIEGVVEGIRQSRDRFIVVGLLDIQVQAGEISEGDALSILDDWKEKNLRVNGEKSNLYTIHE